MGTRKRFLSILLALVMMLTLLPATALADEPDETGGPAVEVTDGEQPGGTEETPEVPETPEETETPEVPETPQEPTLQERIDALPGAEELDGMDEDERQAVSEQARAILDELEELDEEAYAALDLSKLEALTVWFQNEPETLEEPAAQTETTVATAEELKTAISEANAGDTIKLTGNLTDMGSITINKDVTVDGGNYEISGNSAFYVAANNHVTITNTKFKNIHNSDSKLSAVYASGLAGKLTITGCEFDTCDWDAIQTTPVAGATISITGNTFRNTGEQGINTRRYVHVESNESVDFTVTVTNNKFYDGSKLLETALEVYFPTNVDKVKLNGNYIDEPMSTCIIMNRYTTSNRRPDLALPFADSSLTTTVMPEASITESTYNYYYYPTLQEAINSVTGGTQTTITLQGNVVIDSADTINIPAEKNIVINQNGKKVAGKIVNNGTLTISGAGAENSSGAITNAGTLTMDGDAAAAYSVENSGALKIMKGATYDLSKISSTGTVSIYGGTFTTKPNDNMLAEWYTASQQEDSTYKVVKMTLEQAVAAGAVASSASSGTIYYSSVSTAVSGTNTSAYLQKDVNEEIVGTNSRNYGNLYANGYHLTGSLSLTSTSTNSNKYYQMYADKNGTIKLTSAKYNGDLRACSGTFVLDYVEAPSLQAGSLNTTAQVTVKDAKVSGAVTVAASGSLTIEGGQYNTLQRNIYYEKGETAPAYESELTVTGGTFNSDKVTLKYTNHPNSTASEEKSLSDYVPAGYQVITNSDNTYSVVPKTSTVTPAAAAYKVEHYQEQLDGTYTLVDTDFPLYGELNTTVTATPKTYEHYSVDPSKSTASGTVVMPTVVDGQPVILTLKLCYKLDTHTVSFASALDQTNIPADHSVKYGGEAILPAALAAEGYTFAGWKCGDKVYQPGDKFTVEEDVTFTAQWNEIVVPGGDSGTQVEVASGETKPEADKNLSEDEKEVADEIVSGITESEIKVVGDENLTDAAHDVAKNESVVADAVAKAEKNGVTAGEGETLTVVVETYMEVTVNDVNADAAKPSVTLEITPKYDVKVSNGTVETTVVSGAKLEVTETVIVTLPLPTIFQNAVNIYVKHEAKTGVYYYAAMKDSENSVITFTNPHGFSEFTIVSDTRSVNVDFNGKEETLTPADVNKALSGNYTVPSGKRFDGWKFEGIDGTYTTLTDELLSQLAGLKDENGAPIDTIEAAPVFSNRSSGGSSSGATTYPVTVEKEKNGEVTVSHKNASKGTTVTITVKPDKGYELDDLTVTDKDGDTVKLTKKSDTKYTFTMPASKVEVEAVFTKIEEAHTFIDVPDSHWAGDEIAWAYENGYMNGNTAVTFDPNGTVTRQQLWMILARLSGQRPASFAEAKSWAVDNGISDGTDPGGAVTRQQMVAILYRYAQLMGYGTSGSAALTAFPDSGSVAAYAIDAMSWSVANGIVGGTTQGTLDPAGTATRAQFAVILYRFCDKAAK